MQFSAEYGLRNHQSFRAPPLSETPKAGELWPRIIVVAEGNCSPQIIPSNKTILKVLRLNWCREGSYTKTMKQLFGLWLLAAGSVGAQNIGYGIRGGIPLTDSFDFVKQFSLQKVQTSRFTIGPTLEVRLPLGLSVQVDALYKRHKIVNGTSTASNWELPLLAKYRLPGLLTRPFVEGGVSFQSLGEIAKFATNQGVDKSRRGFVMGAGVEAKLMKVRLSPEIRWTRWGDAKFLVNPTSLLNASSQFEVLVGLTF